MEIIICLTILGTLIFLMAPCILFGPDYSLQLDKSLSNNADGALIIYYFMSD